MDFGGQNTKMEISKWKGGAEHEEIVLFFGSNSLNKEGSLLDSHRLAM